MMDAIVAAGTRALHGLMVTSRRAYMHRLSYTWDCPKQVQCLVPAAPTSVPSLAFRVDLHQHVYTVCSAGMSRLIPKSPPSPPCLFPNHLIKEMSVPKPYPACSPYSQRFFSAKSGSFASGISQHTSKISIHECISLHWAVHRKQTLEDHPTSKQSPDIRSSEKPPQPPQSLWHPLFLLQRKLTKILHWNPTKPSELLLRAQIRSPVLVSSPLTNIIQNIPTSPSLLLALALAQKECSLLLTLRQQRQQTGQQLEDASSSLTQRVLQWGVCVLKGEIQQ